MTVSRHDLEEALVDGATQGLTSAQLFASVREQYPKAKTAKIVRAAFHALSDPALKDRNIMDVIYALALKHRMDKASDDGEEDDGVDDDSHKVSADVSSMRAVLPLPEVGRKGKKKH